MSIRVAKSAGFCFGVSRAVELVEQAARSGANADVKGTAKVYQVAGDSLDNDNILGAKEDCIMEEFTVDGIGEKFNYTVPMYSATVIRVSR